MCVKSKLFNFKRLMPYKTMSPFEKKIVFVTAI